MHNIAHVTMTQMFNNFLCRYDKHCFSKHITMHMEINLFLQILGVKTETKTLLNCYKYA